MESAHMFNNRFDDNINTIKMDLENNQILKHSKNIRNFIFAKRKINYNNDINIISNNKNENIFNAELIINNINQVIFLFEKIHQNENKSLNKNQINEIKTVLTNYLIQIRKELSKENISKLETQKIFNSNLIKIFCESLINPINDTNDPFIQLESIWIINNLMFLVAKYNDIISLDVSNITKMLIQYLVNIYNNRKNDGVKYTLEEKILRIFGNLICINDNVLMFLIENEIIPFIIESLNSPIPSFRITCLWIINKILLILRKNGNSNLISYFTTKIASSNYKFILSRIPNQNNFDEISELFWVFNELVKYDQKFLIPIFFTDVNNKMFNGFLKINKAYALNKFTFILDNCLTDKMLQPCLRLISNLLIICYKDIKDEDLLTQFLQNLFSRESIFRFLNEFMTSENNKLDYSLAQDILLLIFNLVNISPNNSSSSFKNGIIHLLNNKEYQKDIKMIQLLYYIYYKIMKNNSFYFEAIDELVIKSSLYLIEIIKNDFSILCIVIDIFYFYLKASNIVIDDNTENELKILINTKENITNNNLIILLVKLSNYIQMIFN